jgi:hypothetical protein
MALPGRVMAQNCYDNWQSGWQDDHLAAIRHLFLNMSLFCYWPLAAHLDSEIGAAFGQ